MKDLTKLFCDLLSAGSAIAQAEPSQIAQHVVTIAHNSIPDGFHTDMNALEEHIGNLQVCRRNAEAQMIRDNREPVYINRVTTFHGKMTVILSDGRELHFNAHDIVNY